MHRSIPLIALALAAVTPADAAQNPVVIELFTSEGCSSCPPADALLTELAQTRPDVLPLAFHVTYWNSLGWRDPFSLDLATARQRRYARLSGVGGVYTPQAIVGGTEDVIGSDRAAILHALQTAAAGAKIPVAVQRTAAGLSIAIGPGPGAGQVLLVGYDPTHRTKVLRGENAGATLVESNIVRALTVVAEWRGADLTLTPPPIDGERQAVILQSSDGRILGAALVPE